MVLSTILFFKCSIKLIVLYYANTIYYFIVKC